VTYREDRDPALPRRPLRRVNPDAASPLPGYNAQNDPAGGAKKGRDDLRL
jgi:hypothetical protein